MSFRTLIEVNHDLAHGLDYDFLRKLQAYLSSAGGRDAEALERYGVKVIGMRHHADSFVVQGIPDGFPVRILPAQPKDTKS